jgi:hypothetical protein
MAEQLSAGERVELCDGGGIDQVVRPPHGHRR